MTIRITKHILGQYALCQLSFPENADLMLRLDGEVEGNTVNETALADPFSYQHPHLLGSQGQGC